MVHSDGNSVDNNVVMAMALLAMHIMLLRELRGRRRASCSCTCGTCGSACSKIESGGKVAINSSGNFRIELPSSTPSRASRHSPSGSRRSSGSRGTSSAPPSPGALGSLLPALMRGMPTSPPPLSLSATSMHAPSSTFTTPTRTPTSSVAEEDEDVELDDKAHVRALQLLKSNAPASREEYKATIDPDAEVVLVVDIGSTSIKCSAFVADELVEQPSTPTAGAAVACDNGGKSKDLPDGMARRRTILELHFAAQRAPSPTFTEQGYIADARVVLSQVEAVVEACLQRLREAGVRRVTKFGFSSLVMNLFGVDLLGQPVTPVFTYASSEPHAAHFNPSFHERFDHHALTGTSMHHPSYALVQLKAFYERFPEIAASVHQWTTLSSYILGCWTTTSPSMGARTGVEIPMHTSSIDTSFEFCPVSFSEASWTGLFKTDDLSWCGKALHYLPGLRANTLPRLCDFNDYLGHTRSSLAARWPELQGCRFHLGIGDGAAANLGSAAQCLAEGFAVDACVSVGTSAAVRVLVGSRAHSEVSPPVPLGLWCYRVDRNRCLVGGALTDGGSLVEWFGHCFGRDALAAALEDLEELVLREQESEAWKPAPGSELFVLPFWSGERSTGWHTHATGHIAGFTRSTSRLDVLHGLLEGLCVRLFEVMRLLVKSGVLEHAPASKRPADSSFPDRHEEYPGRLLTLGASGGALTSCPALCQMLADVTGMRVAVQGQRLPSSPSTAAVAAEASPLPVTESTSLGVATLLFSSPTPHAGADHASSTGSGSEGEVASVPFIGSAEGLSTALFLPRLHMTKHYARRLRRHHLVYDSNMPAST